MRRGRGRWYLLTDGIDTASMHSGEDAAMAAARLDLPVYVVGVGSLAGRGSAERTSEPGSFSVADFWRAGPADSPGKIPPAELTSLTQSILDELHHQYVIAFAAGTEPGWHPLQVRVKGGRVNARSRDGYYVR